MKSDDCEEKTEMIPEKHISSAPVLEWTNSYCTFADKGKEHN
jgi:hypothetical protein